MESSRGLNSAIPSCWREETSSPVCLWGVTGGHFLFLCFFSASLQTQVQCMMLATGSPIQLHLWTIAFDKGILKSLLGVIQAVPLMVWG